ncbi:lipoxygenase family protein [Pseudanabaena sp. PCC 6802]|uniref:lipoxygenase family protein n=1 Tax=Pseudanabaena sp. PCC 6802 TaxID=118173 RepID=UPI00034AFE2C|nr:lipoxygenase family protein [Pseudanabaena sp. PCC 6802]
MTASTQPLPKDLFPYIGKEGEDLPRFDPQKPLPPKVAPNPRLVANMGLHTIPAKPVPPLALLGIAGVTDIIQQMPTPNIMPANLTRCRPDKFSDAFFVDRRLNGFNPGKLNRTIGQEWQYVVRYDCRKYAVDPGGILPATIEARFVLRGHSLYAHSIQYVLREGNNISNAPITNSPGDADWEWAKRLFRSAEFLFQETQAHLARTHLNVEQYAMAYYRNVKNNKIAELLEPHFEGLLNINKLGANIIFGDEGVIPQSSTISTTDVEKLLKEEVSRLNYHTWHPRMQALQDFVSNNHYDRAAIAVWEIVEQYVGKFFQDYESAIRSDWAEIEGMSQDLVGHSILKRELGTLKIHNINDLKKLCIYVIYHSSFLHSWTNYKQYEDGGDIEYAALGLWDEKHPSFDPAVAAKRNIGQVLITWTLSSVRYNPIMENGSSLLKDLLWQRRDEIQPGLPLEMLMMSIHI